MMPKALKDFASAIVTTLLLAAVVTFAGLFAGPPAYGQPSKPQVGDMIYAMVKIQQPLKIDADVFNNYQVGGDLYTTMEACGVAARQAMLMNAAEMANGTATHRVFSGCITIPAPGKAPLILPPADDRKGTSI